MEGQAVPLGTAEVLAAFEHLLEHEDLLAVEGGSSVLRPFGEVLMGVLLEGLKKVLLGGLREVLMGGLREVLIVVLMGSLKEGLMGKWVG